MEKTTYLAEIKAPHIEITDAQDEALASKEIDEYLKKLEVLRLDFVESLSSCREKVALAYIGELYRVKMIATRRIEGVFSIALPEGVLSNARLRNKILRGMNVSVDKALEFVQVIAPNSFVGQSIQTVTAEAREHPKTESKFHKKLADYGELLTVKDLCEIFDITPRTVTNWEAQGLLVNISAVSEETNSLGRKKRGLEKRYRKESILKSIALQEKYNALL